MKKLQVYVYSNPDKPHLGKVWKDVCTSDKEVYRFRSFEQWTGYPFYRDHVLMGEARIVDASAPSNVSV